MQLTPSAAGQRWAPEPCYLTPELRTCLAAPPAGAPSAALLPVAALALGREASRVAWALEAASTSAAEPRVSAAVTARALSSSRSAAGRAPSPGATARAYKAAMRDAAPSPETCSSRWMAPWQPQQELVSWCWGSGPGWLGAEGGGLQGSGAADSWHVRGCSLLLQLLSWHAHVEYVSEGSGSGLKQAVHCSTAGPTSYQVCTS